MAGNKQYIRMVKEFRRRVEHIVPQCYACIALALHREFGFGFTRINRLFVRSQEIWNESIERDIDMVQMCLDETGIECRSAVEHDHIQEKNKR